MSQRVYSTRFIQELGLTAVAIYTVPLGFRAVLRDLDAYCDATGEVTLFLEGARSQAIFRHGWSTGDKLSVQWSGRQVLYEGETVKVTANVGEFDAVDVTVCGYLLDDSA